MMNLRRPLAIGLMLVAALVGSSAVARAQVTIATLYGVVHDSTGGILPGVSVVITQMQTIGTEVREIPVSLTRTKGSQRVDGTAS
jgi:hypothetical protein